MPPETLRVKDANQILSLSKKITNFSRYYLYLDDFLDLYTKPR